MAKKAKIDTLFTIKTAENPAYFLGQYTPIYPKKNGFPPPPRGRGGGGISPLSVSLPAESISCESLGFIMYWRQSPFNSALYQLVLIKEHKSVYIGALGSYMALSFITRLQGALQMFYRHFLRTIRGFDHVLVAFNNMQICVVSRSVFIDNYNSF